ncbi:DUF4262 domain-containing protein [Derxia lacustris]|uniref:DUF4262 domain-containing protein n=1 Tax=Derxia lacustris TaxID=764842 RepID=UPI000A16CFBE|nr:DUF4262 domain-containing protein [Derxia lacustris]
MSISPEQRHENDERVKRDIEKFGCHVVGVFGKTSDEPDFAYSIGIQQTTGSPEAIVVGLSVKLGHVLIMKYLDQVQSGKIFSRGSPYHGFLEGCSVYFEPVEKEALAEYTFGCERYYRNRPFNIVQIVYPTPSGVWPWEETASAQFVRLQPMLGRLRPDRP